MDFLFIFFFEIARAGVWLVTLVFLPLIPACVSYTPGFLLLLDSYLSGSPFRSIHATTPFKLFFFTFTDFS